MPKGNPPVECVCVLCGSKFKVSYGEFKRGGGKYCSRKCYKAATEVDHITVNCAHCGKPFHTAIYRKRGANKYCSKECVDEARKNRVPCVCQQCGKSFTVSPAQLQRNEGKYCSRACYEVTTKGAGNPMWRGGQFRSYGLTWKDQKRLAYERDGGVCQHCGLTEKQAKKKYGFKNSVHHIIKRRTFREQGKNIEESNSLSNLLVLCASCHRLAESAKITLQPKIL